MNEISFQSFLQSLNENPREAGDSAASQEDGRETLDLVKHYYQIGNTHERQLVVELVKAIARRHTE